MFFPLRAPPAPGPQRRSAGSWTVTNGGAGRSPQLEKTEMVSKAKPDRPHGALSYEVTLLWETVRAQVMAFLLCCSGPSEPQPPETPLGLGCGSSWEQSTSLPSTPTRIGTRLCISAHVRQETLPRPCGSLPGPAHPPGLALVSNSLCCYHGPRIDVLVTEPASCPRDIQNHRPRGASGGVGTGVSSDERASCRALEEASGGEAAGRAEEQKGGDRRWGRASGRGEEVGFVLRCHRRGKRGADLQIPGTFLAPSGQGPRHGLPCSRFSHRARLVGMRGGQVTGGAREVTEREGPGRSTAYTR